MIKYFISYFGDSTALAWNDEKEIFVPYWQRLYVSTWTDITEAKKVLEKVRSIAADYADRIFLDCTI